MKLYAEFTKVDADERIVSGYASTEAVDSQNEIVTRKAMEAALPDWLKFGNIREMHQPSAVGVAVNAEMREKGLFLEAHVVDDNAWKKVKRGVYKGFSIGGHVKGRDDANKAIITDLDLTEISLVDRPANPEALFDVWKVDGAEKAEDVAVPDAVADPLPEAPIKPEPVKTEEQVVEPKSEETAKGMFGVGRLAEILSQIQCAAQDSEWEAEIEGDDSTMPDALKSWLKDGGKLLVQMATEETAEMPGPDDAVDLVVLSDATGDLEKKGRRNNAADQQKLNDAHDALVAAGAECGGAMKSADTEDLSKARDDLVQARADLVKVATGLAESQTTLLAMSKAREDADAALEAIAKTHEAVLSERDALAKSVETLTSEKASVEEVNASLITELEKFKSAPAPMKGRLLAFGKGDDVSEPVTAKSFTTTAQPVPANPPEKWFSAR